MESAQHVLLVCRACVLDRKTLIGGAEDSFYCRNPAWKGTVSNLWPTVESCDKKGFNTADFFFFFLFPIFQVPDSHSCPGGGGNAPLSSFETKTKKPPPSPEVKARNVRNVVRVSCPRSFGQCLHVFKGRLFFYDFVEV